MKFLFDERSKLKLHRTRLGLTQSEFASMLCLNTSYYRQIEKGIGQPPFKTRMPSAVKDYERCMLMRWRLEVTTIEVASKLSDIRPHDIILMEKGLIDCNPLIWYWEC